MQPYAHQTLSAQSSIRILTLEPASDFNAPLRCRLTDVNLNREEISYEALSYVWGSATGTNSLSCEGQELLITPNCESALRHLRFKSRDRNLWVDAVCIDQKSTSEREQQVKMMGDVFGKATQVLIWLGDSNSKTALAFAYLRTLYAWYWLPFSSVIVEVLNWKWIGNGMSSADRLYEHVPNQKL
jgi:Heterokaryon incompatibility protein (HET)